MTPLICSLYKSPRHEEMYLYVKKTAALKQVPEALLAQFGEPQWVFDMLLKEDKKLARAQAKDVLTSIEDKGFYLQMPPARDAYMLDLYKAPTEAKY